MRETPRPATRVVRAQLTVTDAALARLLAVSGSQGDFVLSSLDGETTVRVGLAISAVPDSQIALGKRGVVLDWARPSLSIEGALVPLTRMELKLLVALLEHAPAAATHEHLMSRMWPNAKRVPDGVAALHVWVCGLRRRFASLSIQNAIRTVRGEGYALSL